MVIDGQGGKMGKGLVEQLKKLCPEDEILAIGTNSIATAAMLKAGADAGATGENPAVVTSRTADIIVPWESSSLIPSWVRSRQKWPSPLARAWPKKF